MQETLVQFPGLGRSAEEGIGCLCQYSWASLVAQLLRIRPQCRRPGFSPWVGKIPWKRERQTTPVLWPGEIHGLYSPRGHRESDMTKRLWLSFNLFVLLLLLFSRLHFVMSQT